MDKVLQRKLIRIALYSSPLLALSGITPVYLFRPVNSLIALRVFSLITILALIFWYINIYLYKKFGDKKPITRYALSYFLTFSVQFILMFAVPRPDKLEQVNKYAIIYPFLIVLAINTMIILMYNTALLGWEKNKAEKELDILRVSNLEAQRQMLMQQLQPHFLFNTLSVLKSLIRENPDEAENYAVKLSEFLRYSVQVHNKDLVTLKEELKFAQDYIELQQVRFENSLHCEFSISGDQDKFRLPAYALQVLLENAIKHNFFTEKKPLHIQIVQQNDYISVCNNRLPGKATDGTGTGLSNLTERYKFITVQPLKIVETSEQFCVQIPLIQYS
jgi:two-component system, LytTR family, sensor kinase